MKTCNLKNPFFEAYGHSLTCYKKEKCGDQLLLQDIKKESSLVAIVSDGISGRPCDWLASDLTCSKFIEYFSGNDKLQIKERIHNGIQFANDQLLAVEDKCQSLAATLVILVWDYTNSHFYFVSIGDSRLYRIRGNELKCLTLDDAHKGRKQIVDELGKRFVETSSLTNAVGRPNIKMTLQEELLQKGDLMLLTTDGFYEARRFSFEKSISELGNSNDLAVDFENLFRKWEIAAKDDMTAIVLRRK